MKTIWKFALDVTDAPSISMPVEAQILSLQVQNGVPCIWALVDPSLPQQPRQFRVFGTGHPVDGANDLTFIGTFQIHAGALVFHCFEVTPA